MSVNRKRLYRCRYDRQIAGVAGGIAEYLEVDPTIVRLAWIISVFFGGVTLLLYVVMVFIVPLEPVGYGAWPAPGGAAGGSGASGPSGEGVGDGPATATTPGATDGAAAGLAAGTDPHAAARAQHAATAGVPHRHAGGGSGGSLLTITGVLLLIFGGIALVGPALPGWVAGLHLGPAFIVALGIALLAASVRRGSPDRQPALDHQPALDR
jgi:phage shock protein C